MTTTPNLGLTKDAPNEQYSVERVNANSDRIDEFAGDVNAALATKQDTIADLSEIRSGAAAGATAVQQTTFETDQQRQDALEAADRAALVEVLDSGAKNIIKPVSQIVPSGIAVTINADGTIRVTSDGTNAQAVMNIATQSTFEMVNGEKYVLSGCAGGSSTTYDLRLSLGGTNYTEYGEGVSFTYGGQATYGVAIVIRAAQTLDVTFKPMICTKAAWDISQTYQPYRKDLAELTVDSDEDRAALVELVDGGAKNMLNLDDAITSAVQYHATSSLQNSNLLVTSAGAYARVAIPFLFSNGTSVFSCDVSDYTRQGGAINLRFAKNSDSTDSLREAVVVSGNGKVSAEITVDTETQGFIIFYINTSSTSYQNSATFSDVILCTKAAWDISQNYVPYAPTNRELYEMILALQNRA